MVNKRVVLAVAIGYSLFVGAVVYLIDVALS